MRVPRVLPAATLAAVLSLALAACGSGSGTGSASGSASGEGGSGSSELSNITATPTAALSAQEAQAVSSYLTYVRGQVDDSVAKTKELVEAVKAGDITKAKSLYAPSRVGWEAIEPVAAVFGDTDPKVDLREADVQSGDTWTGWHVIEKALWKTGSTTDMGAVGDQLVADLENLKTQVNGPDGAKIDAQVMALGAKELMDEIASGKITGEEEAFSHTDLVDFKANLDGARKVFELLTPLISIKDPGLVSTISTEFSDVDTELNKYKSGDSYVSYDTVTETQRKDLTNVVNALAEPLSRMGAAMAGAGIPTISPEPEEGASASTEASESPSATSTP